MRYLKYLGKKQKIKIITYALALLTAVGGLIFGLEKFVFRADVLPGESQVDTESLTNNGDQYPDSTKQNPKIPKYEKFELTFDINWYEAGHEGDANYKYDPLTVEWSQVNTYQANDSVSWNSNIYRALVDIGAGANQEPGQPGGETLWQDTGRTAINPYWPYDENPIPNQYFRDNHPDWNSSTTYTAGQNNVMHNGTIYASIKTNINIEPGVTPGWETYWRANPPDPVPAGKGISVDGLFLPSGETDWNNAKVQPGFYYQDFERGHPELADNAGSREWLYPNGPPVWKIRFAPQTISLTDQDVWSYKIRVTDATGTTTYESPSNNFLSSEETQNKGFVKVSADDHDPRYFETSDGTYLNFIGLSDYTTSTYGMDDTYDKYEDMGINLIRPWWQSQQGPQLFGITNDGGTSSDWWSSDWQLWDIERHMGYDWRIVKEGELFYFKLGQDGKMDTRAYVKPGKSYRLSAWVKTDNISQGDGASLIVNGVPLNQKLTGTTNWTPVTQDITTSNYEISVGVKQASNSPGQTYFTGLSLREIKEDGALGPSDYISKPNLNLYQYVSQYQAFKADYMVKSAKDRDIYLKIVTQYKQDQIWGRIMENGTAKYEMTEINVYATDISASRTYQQYYWRYLIARYGFATSIHSFEFLNEGNPQNNRHRGAAQAMALYFKQNDPNRHLVTTSTWSGFPLDFWTVDAYRDLGYGDVHGYPGYMDIRGWSPKAEIWPDTPIVSFPFVPDTNTYKPGSAPRSLHFEGIDGSVYGWFLLRKKGFPITPGHTYKVSYYVKGINVPARNNSYPQETYIWGTIWANSNGARLALSGPPGPHPSGNFDWTYKEFVIRSPSINDTPPAAEDGWYLSLEAFAPNKGDDPKSEVWYDDITVQDTGTGEYIDAQNGNFDDERINYDTALITISAVSTIVGRDRDFQKPIIRGEIGMFHDQIFGSPYRGVFYTDENQQFLDDTDGIVLRKFIWSHVNPTSLIDMYWNAGHVFRLYSDNPSFKYAKAYQTFMAGIPLDNGNYKDAKATVTVSSPALQPNQSPNTVLRAWGQKDLANNRAHLWIDNKPYTWKAVVDYNLGLNDKIINDPEYQWSSTKSYAQTSISTLNNQVYKSMRNKPGGWAKDHDYAVGNYIIVSNNIYRANVDYRSGTGSFNDEIGNWDLVGTGYSLSPTDPTYAAEWWEDRTSDWWTLLDMPSANPELPPPVSGTVTISGLKGGVYNLRWYDTTTGEITTPAGYAVTAVSNGGNMTIDIPPLDSDIALKVEIKEVTPVSPDNTRQFTYKERYHVVGTKSSDIVKVLVNGQEANIDQDNWSIDVDLPIIGNINTITAIGEDSFGNQSSPARYNLSRRKTADANGDDAPTDGEDFSVLMSDWPKTGLNIGGDLNEDENVNIKDFSIMMSYWGV